MTIKRVQNSAYIRGIYFDGRKQWLNNMVGFGYSVYLPTGGFLQADSLQGLYNMILKYPKISN